MTAVSHGEHGSDDSCCKRKMAVLQRSLSKIAYWLVGGVPKRKGEQPGTIGGHPTTERGLPDMKGGLPSRKEDSHTKKHYVTLTRKRKQNTSPPVRSKCLGEVPHGVSCGRLLPAAGSLAPYLTVTAATAHVKLQPENMFVKCLPLSCDLPNKTSMGHCQEFSP